MKPSVLQEKVAIAISEWAVSRGLPKGTWIAASARVQILDSESAVTRSLEMTATTPAREAADMIRDYMDSDEPCLCDGCVIDLLGDLLAVLEVEPGSDRAVN